MARLRFRPLRPIHHYCLATGTWFAAHGVQNVLFAWLVAMVLRETPQMVGVAQMAMLAPVLLLMLLGGSVADVAGGRRVAMLAQGFALLPGIGLLAVLLFDALSFRAMLVYAVAMGCAVAFLTPARDGLLNHVAEGRIQRTVVLVSLAQFGVQMVGFVVAGMAGAIGPEAVILFQTVVLAGGLLAYRRLPSPPPMRVASRSPSELVGSIAEGCRTVLRSPTMRPVIVQNIATGLFFMGTYIVTVPLLVREAYDGSSADLALMATANMLGLVTSILWLLWSGDLCRPGRALLLAHVLGCVFLAGAGVAAFGLGFWAVVAFIYLWGTCGGVAMSMSRALMQEAAPEGQRGRVMAFFSFSLMGAGPLGALTCGYLVEVVGPALALIAAAVGVFVLVAVVARTSVLWNMSVAPSAAPKRRGWRMREAA